MGRSKCSGVLGGWGFPRAVETRPRMCVCWCGWAAGGHTLTVTFHWRKRTRARSPQICSVRG